MFNARHERTLCGGVEAELVSDDALGKAALFSAMSGQLGLSAGWRKGRVMTQPPVSYKRRRFPPEIIAHAVWLYFRFPLSLRLVEEMPLERGVVVSCETVRCWASNSKFPPVRISIGALKCNGHSVPRRKGREHGEPAETRRVRAITSFAGLKDAAS